MGNARLLRGQEFLKKLKIFLLAPPASFCGKDGSGTWACFNADKQLHRKLGPAVIGADGRKEWLLYGKPFRLWGPTLTAENPRHRLWLDDDRRPHRHGKPAIDFADGQKFFFVHGELTGTGKEEKKSPPEKPAPYPDPSFTADFDAGENGWPLLVDHKNGIRALYSPPGREERDSTLILKLQEGEVRVGVREETRTEFFYDKTSHLVKDDYDVRWSVNQVFLGPHDEWHRNRKTLERIVTRALEALTAALYERKKKKIRSVRIGLGRAFWDTHYRPLYKDPQKLHAENKMLALQDDAEAQFELGYALLSDRIERLSDGAERRDPGEAFFWLTLALRNGCPDAAHPLEHVLNGQLDAQRISALNARVSDWFSLPCIRDAYGGKHWYDPEGRYHRERGPARVYPNGSEKWFRHGKLHRIGGPAKTNSPEAPKLGPLRGVRKWFVEGLPHREDGPAIEFLNGTKKWFRHGKLHRDDGPAVEHADGRREWWLNDRKLSEEAFNARA